MTQPQTNQPLSFKRIELFKKETLGIGSYGAVCKAKCDDLLCAAKIIHPTLFDPTAEFQIARHREHRLPMRRFEQECEFMNALRHPNIVQYLGTHQDPETHLPVLLMELMDDSLTHFLESSQEPIPFHIQINIYHDIAVALSFLHSNDIVHRDMSSNNVLLIGNSRAKVTDFGMAKLGDMNPQATRVSLTMCPGTDVYMPPEATTEDTPRYTEKIDCFSFGVLGIQILTREFPKPGSRMREEIFHGRQMFVRQTEIARRLNHINQVDPNHFLVPIALDCLKDKDVERPSAQELCRRVAALKQIAQYSDSERSVTQERQTAEVRALQQQIEHFEQQHHQLKVNQQQQIQDLNRQIHQKQQQMQVLEQQIVDDQLKYVHQIENLQQQYSTILQEKQQENEHMRQELREKSAKLKNSGQTAASIELSWREGNTAPYMVKRYCDAVISGNVVYIRVDQLVFSYNSTNTTWSELPDCLFTHCSLVMVNDNLTTIGGEDGYRHQTNQLFTLTGIVSRKKWTEMLPPMPTRRTNTVAFCSEANLIVVGGEIGVCVTTVEVLKTKLKQWYIASELPFPLSRSSGTICEDRIYMLGGWGAPLLRTNLVLTCSLRNLLDSCHSGLLGPQLREILSLPPPPTVWSKIADFPVTGSTCVTLDGRLLAIGGEDSNYEPTSAVRTYNATTNSWEVISHMTTPRLQCCAAVLPDNKLMVIGGFTPDYTKTTDCTNTTEIANYE